ncbi:hypothetical protein P171DRAFT_267056 [Karstenula rhodostoma CBS 690.94]|uniref:Uncharacterized protein n=1 Tax=Karstenula rhodostoma CBS 690.94 TaxID=1392251 RepID=A0A9P4PMH9_9PLEO|nr:hypothetical protein P171DRAFT_267056 [Karstenula rhodostoma CBS 690.94]
MLPRCPSIISTPVRTSRGISTMYIHLPPERLQSLVEASAHRRQYEHEHARSSSGAIIHTSRGLINARFPMLVVALRICETSSGHREMAPQVPLRVPRPVVVESTWSWCRAHQESLFYQTYLVPCFPYLAASAQCTLARPRRCQGCPLLVSPAPALYCSSLVDKAYYLHCPRSQVDPLLRFSLPLDHVLPLVTSDYPATGPSFSPPDFPARCLNAA